MYNFELICWIKNIFNLKWLHARLVWHVQKFSKCNFPIKWLIATLPLPPLSSSSREHNTLKMCLLYSTNIESAYMRYCGDTKSCSSPPHQLFQILTRRARTHDARCILHPQSIPHRTNNIFLYTYIRKIYEYVYILNAHTHTKDISHIYRINRIIGFSDWFTCERARASHANNAVK